MSVMQVYELIVPMFVNSLVNSPVTQKKIKEWVRRSSFKMLL